MNLRICAKFAGEIVHYNDTSTYKGLQLVLVIYQHKPNQSSLLPFLPAYTLLTFTPIKADAATLIVALSESAAVQYFPQTALTRDKAAAAARRFYSTLRSIERIVLTRESFVPRLQSPDPCRVYKEARYSPESV